MVLERCNELCTKPTKGICNLCEALAERDRFLRMLRGGRLYDGMRVLFAKELPKAQGCGYQNVRRQAPDWLIDNITEASKNTRSLYFLYLGFLAYCVLTVFSTDDRRLIVGQFVKLPIVGLDVNLDGFFLFAPLIAILVFIYFQLYFYHLKSLIADLRTGYASVEKRRLYPWMLNMAEEPDSGIIGHVQVGIVKVTVWWLLPIVLAMMNVRYMYRHDPISYGLNLLPMISMGSVVYFWNLSENTKWQGYLRRHLGKCTLMLMTLLYVAIMHWHIIPQAIQGNAALFSRLAFNIDLSYEGLVAPPTFEATYWADFRGLNLRGADLTDSGLGKANLENADMGKARLLRANLQEANLEEANLQQANLFGANLQQAKLGEANLQQANLGEANLQQAELAFANLQQAELRDGKLQQATLAFADLQQADLQDGKLQQARLLRANLQQADLEGADLQEANLAFADLQEANLGEANLQEANLGGADLRHIQLWDASQLHLAFWDEHTKWPGVFRPPCLRHLPPLRCKWLDIWGNASFTTLFLNDESQESPFKILPLPPYTLRGWIYELVEKLIWTSESNQLHISRNWLKMRR